MYDYWYNYVKQKYGKKAKLYYTNTGSFIVHLASEEIEADLVQDVKRKTLTHLTMKSKDN